MRVALLGLAAVALVAVPAGAQMLTQVSVAEPGSGAAVSGPGVVVEVRGLGTAEAAQARLLAGGQSRVTDLSGPHSLTGGSRWSGNLHLAGLPNGPARVEARAQFSSGMTGWSGHVVQLDLPAPAISLHVAPVPGRSDAVALTWPAAGVPDVSGYEVQRAIGDGGFQAIKTTGADQHAHTDVEVPPGTHRYRVRAVRPGAGGAARPGPWAEGAAILEPGVAGASGDPDRPTEPTSGVAAAPRTGGISARLRAGTEETSLPEGSMLAPQVAPRDLPLTAPPPDVAESEGGGSLATGDNPTLAVSHDGAEGLGGDTVRLVALGLVALLALRARQIARRPALTGSSGLIGLRSSSRGDQGGPVGSGEGEAWRGAREWSRSSAA